MVQYPAIHPDPAPGPTTTERRVLSVAEVDTLRRARLLRFVIIGMASLLILFSLFILVNPAVRNFTTLVSILAPIALCGIGYYINRVPTTRRVAVAAYLSIGGFAVTTMLSFIATPLSAETLRLLDILLIPTIAAGVVIGSEAPFVFASASSLFICTIVLLVPPTPTLFAYEYGSAALCQHLGAAAGQGCPTLLAQIFSSTGVGPVGVILQPIALQFIVALLTWLSMRSIQAAYRSVDRAVELEAAYKTLADQKQELEEDIQALQHTYARVVNGDYSARAHLEGRILWPLAQSLNTMLDRLGRALLQSQRLAKIEGDIRQLTENLERGRRGLPWAWPMPSGTPVDQLVSVLQQAAAKPGQQPHQTGGQVNPPPAPQRSRALHQPVAPSHAPAPWETPGEQ